LNDSNERRLFQSSSIVSAMGKVFGALALSVLVIIVSWPSDVSAKTKLAVGAVVVAAFGFPAVALLRAFQERLRADAASEALADLERSLQSQMLARLRDLEEK
jgi:hypothetical protein